MMASINLAMNDVSLLECIVTYNENTAHIMFENHFNERLHN